MLQCFRTKIFLATSDAFTARTAAELSGKAERLKASYQLTEAGRDARVSLLTGRAAAHKVNGDGLRTALPRDPSVGVFHALTLGLGLCLLVALTRQFNVHQVESVLFGSLLTVTDGDLALLLAVGILVAGLLVREYNHLLLDSLNPPFASVAGAEPAYLEYFFALLLTLSIVVSLKIIAPCWSKR